MKRIRDHVFTLGAVGILALSVVLAQDQAPAVAPDAAPDVPAPVDAVPAAPTAPVKEAPAAKPAAIPAPAVPRPATPSLIPSRRTQTPSPISSRIPGTALPAAAQAGGDAAATNTAGEAKSKTTTPALKFDNAPSDIIVSAYCEQTGKTPLWAPDAPKANITLKSQPDAQLTKEEYIEAIEVVLSMNGIVLEPFGEKFVKVLARKTVRTDGIKIITEGPDGSLMPIGGVEGLHPEKSKVVSQMIQLKAITAAEAQKALEGFKKPDGLFQVFERTNSILVTDTQENVNRMLEIVKFIDQPLMVLEKVYYKVIRFAKAEDIKKRIEELVAESQKQAQANKEEIKANPSGAPGITRTTTTPTISTTRPLPPGLTRLGSTTQPPAVTPNETLEALVSDAERGMIRGKVQIIADERTNQLIIITREDNMAFFEQIIAVLDIETTPDVKVEVQRLKFADAEEVSSMLNDLIGNAVAKKDDKAPASGVKPPAPGAPGAGEPSRSTTLAEAVAARTASRSESSSAEPGKTKLGQLSKDNIKILSDKRTNAIIMMGSVSDLAAIKEIINNMDIQLSQVLIETVAIEVGLGDSVETGIDWVRRVKATGDDSYTYTYTDSDGKTQTKTVTDGSRSVRYGAGGGGGSGKAQNLFNLITNAAGVATDVVTSGGSGLEYLATMKSLNLDVVIKAAKSDNSAKVLSSPIIMTVDNKEATIEATELKYMYKGMRYMGYSGSGYNGYGGGSYEPDIEQRDVGLTVKVTPRINPNGNVILTVEETFEDVLGSQTINGQDWPTITTRKLSADVSVGNGETVILGGLVKTAKSNSESGIPVLKDIPYVGKYLFGSVKTAESRSELLVFLTPYVIETPEDMAREARRRKDYIDATDIWTKGWSESKLADPVEKSEMNHRLERKKELEKAWRTYREKLEELNEVDRNVDSERIRTEAVLDAGRGMPTNATVRTLKVEQSVKVLKPEGKGERGADAGEAPDAAGREAEPAPPAIDQPRKPWWKRVFS